MIICVKAKRLFYSLLITTAAVMAQETLQGTVYSAVDSTALAGASVYFDGTSLGVSANERGVFKISLQEGVTSALIISSLGYKTQVLTNYRNAYGQLPAIYLAENNESLEAVHLETDPWTRKKKEGIFLREFLGTTPGAAQTRIKNLHAVQLRYIPSREVLLAVAEEPLVLINKHLGYELRYTLKDFKVDFSTGSSGLQFTYLVYFEGFSLFKELHQKPRKKHLKNRKRTFEGSPLHFMRALAEKKLLENKFQIFYDKFEVPPYQFFKISTYEKLTAVQLLQDKLVILYDQFEQSSLAAPEVFYIDPFGNFTPPQNVIFSGSMGRSRMAQMLPLNYNL